jgi:translocation and assembly module TamA
MRLFPTTLLCCAAALIAGGAFAEVRVEVSGGDEALNTNVRNHIGKLRAHELQRPRFLQRRLRRLISPAAEALGYYETRFDLQIDGETARITLNPGEPVRWAAPAISILGEAAQLKPMTTRVRDTPIRAGDVINHGTYDRYKQQLQETCREYGFLDARYERSELRVDVPSRTARATLELDCGQRYQFGAVTFSSSQIEPDLLRRLSPIEAGTPYRKRRISDLYRNLQGSRYFADIDIVPTANHTTHQVDIAASVTDAPRNRFLIGLGYGTDTGPRTRFGWQRPIVNSAGHSFEVETTLTDPIQQLNADYRIPLSDPLNEFISVPVEFERKIIEDTDSTLGRAGLFYNDVFAEVWRGRVGANVEVESYQQGSEPRKTVRYLVPGAALTRQVQAEGIDPLSGNKTWMEAWGSLTELGADTAFLRANIGHKRLFNPWGSHLLIARAEMGAIATDDIRLIPASQRFFTGGDTTVRGFDYESLSTRDANGELIGGQYLNVASLDYSVKVRSDWRAAVFVDTGRAFNSKDEPWRKSAGIGVRWLSPIGQIRVDLAFPIDEPDRDWRLHIFMGPPL